MKKEVQITICKCKGRKCHSFCVYLGVSFSLVNFGVSFWEYLVSYQECQSPWLIWFLGVSFSLVDLVSWSVSLLS
ncbi:unnamed protein product [Malus baccata var. baccata]